MALVHFTARDIVASAAGNDQTCRVCPDCAEKLAREVGVDQATQLRQALREALVELGHHAAEYSHRVDKRRIKAWEILAREV